MEGSVRTPTPHTYCAPGGATSFTPSTCALRQGPARARGADGQRAALGEPDASPGGPGSAGRRAASGRRGRARRRARGPEGQRVDTPGWREGWGSRSRRHRGLGPTPQSARRAGRHRGPRLGRSRQRTARPLRLQKLRGASQGARHRASTLPARRHTRPKHGAQPRPRASCAGHSNHGTGGTALGRRGCSRHTLRDGGR